MRRKSNEEHLLHGTFRPDRHGKRKKKEPAIAADESGCPDADINVGHVCGPACAENGEPPDITEADIAAEMRYAERLGWFAKNTPERNRRAAIETLTIRRDICSPAEYQAETHGTFEQCRAGKYPAEY